MINKMDKLQNIHTHCKPEWMPYDQYLAIKFVSRVVDTLFINALMWGYKKDKEREYRIAKRIYEEEFKDILSINYLEYYNKK